MNFINLFKETFGFIGFLFCFRYSIFIGLGSYMYYFFLTLHYISSVFYSFLETSIIEFKAFFTSNTGI